MPLPEARASAADVDTQRGESDDRVNFDPQIVGLLFADVKGFSALKDNEIPRFVERVLGAIAEEVAQLPRPPLISNTWGDGLYLVFDGIRETGEFALRLCEADAISGLARWDSSRISRCVSACTPGRRTRSRIP